MFGSFRFILASLVALSHIGVNVYGKNPGVMAVVSFYLLSGFMMTGLIRRYYDSYARFGFFYLDRIVRIFPQYLFVCLLVVVLLQTSQVESPFVQLEQQNEFSIFHFINNFLIIPLNFYMFNASDQMTLIPPAWSLGAELQFYLLIPFILLAGERFRLMVICASFSLFVLASFNIIHSDWYGYRLLPGIIYIFLSGSLLYDHHKSNRDSSYSLLLIYCLVLVCFCYVSLYKQWTYPYIFEVCSGFLIALPIANMLRRLKRRTWDEYLGHLSYGVFLVHFLVLWGCQSLFELDIKQFPALFILLCSLLAVVGYELVEKPFFRYRKQKLKNK